MDCRPLFPVAGLYRDASILPADARQEKKQAYIGSLAGRHVVAFPAGNLQLGLSPIKVPLTILSYIDQFLIVKLPPIWIDDSPGRFRLRRCDVQLNVSLSGPSIVSQTDRFKSGVQRLKSAL